MVLPLVVTLFAAVVGNALGYTVMKEFCVNLYRSSYSLTDYSPSGTLPRSFCRL